MEEDWLTDKTNTPHPLAPSPTRGEGEQEWLQFLTPLSRSGRGVGGEGLKLLSVNHGGRLKYDSCGRYWGNEFPTGVV
jgi:hypothetical protein